jgi:hypothetical protein
MFSAFGVGHLFVKTSDVGIAGGPHPIRARIPLPALEVFGDRRGRDGKAIPVSLAISSSVFFRSDMAPIFPQGLWQHNGRAAANPRHMESFEDFP